MNILHYSLGFPPYRTGGLTKYCMDLMLEEKKQGNMVSLLWPGKISVLNHTEKIKERKAYELITSYEIINPLPVPLLEGISDVKRYMQPCSSKMYEEFLRKLKPDVIHVHTLMGIHKEFFAMATQLKIPIVYTSHDYFGICPKVNLFCENKICEYSQNCEACHNCNKGALSYRKIIILQSHLYQKLKNLIVLKKIRLAYKKKMKSKEGMITNKKQEVLIKNPENYLELKDYYREIFGMIYKFHFNSKVAQKVYHEHMPIEKDEVISITHSNIQDCKKIREYTNEKLRITYLGGVNSYKGYYLLKEALEEIDKDNNNFELNVYNTTLGKRNFINFYESYQYEELSDIFEKTDLVVVPSLWQETFGFNVVEAMSYAVPCLVTQNVGAKDILEGEKFGFVVDSSKLEMKKVLMEILQDREKLRKINQNIISNYHIQTMEEHTREILEFYEVK